MSFEVKELKNLFNRIGAALLVFLAADNLLCGGAAEITTIVTAITDSAVAYILTDLLSSVAYFAAYTIPAWFFFRISRNKKTEPVGLSFSIPESSSIVEPVAYGFIGAALCFCLSYVNSLLAPVPPKVAEILCQADLDAGYKLVLMFISVAIVPALAEEFLFRGVILSNIRPYSEGGAILISALLFGLMHQTAFQFLYTTGLGIVLGIVYVKTKSIWCGVILHFFNNYLSIIQEYLMAQQNEKAGYVVYYISILLTFLVGIIMCAIAFGLRNKGTKQTENEIGVFGKRQERCEGAWRQKETGVLRNACFSPAMMIYTVMCVLAMIFNSIMLAVI